MTNCNIQSTDLDERRGKLSLAACSEAGFHLRRGAQGKPPPQTAHWPNFSPKILPIITIMKSTLPSPWPYDDVIRELPQDGIPR